MTFAPRGGVELEIRAHQVSLRDYFNPSRSAMRVIPTQ